MLEIVKPDAGFCTCCCGFLEAGPLLTPGFNPVCDLSDPVFADCDFNRPAEDLAISFVRVLLMVIFMPSKLGFTMYSEFFGSPTLAVGLVPSAPFELTCAVLSRPELVLMLGSVPLSQC